MPRTIVLDAVGTILKPQPDVITAYHDAGIDHGSRLSREDVAGRFKQARATFFSCDNSAANTPAGSLPSSDAIEHQLWKQLVDFVFEDVNPSRLFEQLWDHFASPSNWAIYDDVTACLAQLQQRGDNLIVASNFDSRLHRIMDSITPLAAISTVYCSAEVGFRKPDPEFYRAIAQRIPNDHEVIMIGDDHENDCVAPSLFGWTGIHLNRNRNRNANPSPQNAPSVSSLVDAFCCE